MMIRELVYEDYNEASDLLWKSFYDAEKNVATVEGMSLFRDATSAVSLSVSSVYDGIRYFGDFRDGKLVSVGAIKGTNHILLLYVKQGLFHRGLGKSMLSFLEHEIKEDEITVNASDFALSFYRKQGYETFEDRKFEKGLATTAMKKVKKLSKNS